MHASAPAKSPGATPIRAALVVLFMALLTGCGASAGGVDTDPNGAAAHPLDGEWRLAEMAIGSVAIADAEFSLTISTETAVVSGFTTCHPILGSLSFDGQGFATFTLPGVGTAACDEDDLATEQSIVEAMETVTNWSRQDDALTLSAPGGTALRFDRTGEAPTP